MYTGGTNPANVRGALAGRRIGVTLIELTKIYLQRVQLEITSQLVSKMVFFKLRNNF